MKNIYICLVEPEHPGNVGAIARSMKNFGLSNLILINPKCEHLRGEAMARAMHATDILKKANVRKTLRGFDYIVATTGKLGSDYNVPRVPITPVQLAEKINKKSKIAILFGREGRGLSNKEIQSADFVVSIPASRKYPILNLSHAATIIFYELAKAKLDNKTDSHIVMATEKEKKVIMGYLENILKKTDFATKDMRDTQRKVWKRIFGKAFMTKREAYAVIGLFKKLKP